MSISPTLPLHGSHLPASSTLPLDMLREVQDRLSANKWMLALPELAPFRAFILEAAAACESGEVERELRQVRKAAKAEVMRGESGTPLEDDVDAASQAAREAEQVVLTRAKLLLPQPPPKQIATPRGSLRPRSYSQAQLLAFGPTIHLVRAGVYPDLTRGLKLDAVELFVQMWMVDSHDRCMGGVAQWPTKQGAWLKERALHPAWNSARQLPGASYDAQMTLRIELWDAATDTLIGTARTALAALSTDSMTATLVRPDEEDDVDWRRALRPTA